MLYPESWTARGCTCPILNPASNTNLCPVEEKPQPPPVMAFSASVMVILLIVPTVCAGSCKPSEYWTGEECCPLCPAGSHIIKHCTQFSGADCADCPSGTFIDKSNGQMQCNPCSTCGPDRG
ncbi:tumor necrosis factor receptor superfamily member 14 [Austrofundulus limnaeus]|uniref:Tumor necrosis factor receptor superfamily member 14 n=1 Tax=Austrofundulus limnaeus TaxID=52670 RepID=A0A2I4AI58_AUSLI|nr:PREDICTED: tumor necrosis factor receptor superfamily member 14-like [Austrofundulus limnaeus]